MSIKPPKKQFVWAFSGAAVFAMILMFWAVYSINAFFETYRFRFQTPVIIQTPMWIERRGEILKEATSSAQVAPTPTPTTKPQVHIVQPVLADERPTDKQIIMGKANGDILWKVYILESTRGKNDSCKDKGKFNGFGYGQSTKVWNCFDTFEEVAHKVSVWFDDKMATLSLEEALCYYNEGVVKKGCPYYQKYVSL